MEMDAVILIDDAIDGIDKVVGRAESARGFWREMVPLVRKDVRSHQAERAGPSQRWPPRSRATIDRARRNSKPKRVRGPRARLLGKMPRLNRAFIDPDGVRVRNRVPWSQAHQRGAVVGNRARLPARVFWYVSADVPASVARQLRAVALKEW